MTNLTPRELRIVDYLMHKEKYIKSLEHLHYLKEKGITVLECTEVLGTTELRKIISRLRDKGYKVIDIWEVGENKFGDEVRYKRYMVERVESQMHWDLLDKKEKSIWSLIKKLGRK